jgi:Fe-S cluster assembly scaffold protein SufB
MSPRGALLGTHRSFVVRHGISCYAAVSVTSIGNWSVHTLVAAHHAEIRANRCEWWQQEKGSRLDSGRVAR